MQSKVIMVPEMGTSTQYLSHSSFCHLEGNELHEPRPSGELE
jgi:hypothetical protein